MVDADTAEVVGPCGQRLAVGYSERQVVERPRIRFTGTLALTDRQRP